MPGRTSVCMPLGCQRLSVGTSPWVARNASSLAVPGSAGGSAGAGAGGGIGCGALGATSGVRGGASAGEVGSSEASRSTCPAASSAGGNGGSTRAGGSVKTEGVGASMACQVPAELPVSLFAATSLPLRGARAKREVTKLPFKTAEGAPVHPQHHAMKRKFLHVLASGFSKFPAFE